jgi:hypothetical protein
MGEGPICQTSVIFETINDQVARTAVAGLLLWNLIVAARSAFERWFFLSLIVARTVVGVVFVVFTRTMFKPFCVARSSSIIESIVIISVDGIIATVLFVEVPRLGLLDEYHGSRVKGQKSRGVGLLAMTGAFTFWLAVSARCAYSEYLANYCRRAYRYSSAYKIWQVTSSLGYPPLVYRL